MTQFNINNIIRDYSLDSDELAKVLFPAAKYPKQAFSRILKGEASLSVEQVEILAAHIGVLPSHLFMLDTWKDASEDGLLAFKKGVFLVKLNYNGTFLTLYKNGEVVDQRVISTHDMPIKDLIEYLDNLISNF